MFQRLGSAARVRETLERNLGYLSVAEADYFQGAHRYTADLAVLNGRGPGPLTPDPGNTINILHADSAGFLAVGTNPRLRGAFRSCGIYLGVVTPPNAALKRPSTVACW